MQCFKAGKPSFPGAELFAFICVHLWLKILFTVSAAAGNVDYTGSLVLLWVPIDENWYYWATLGRADWRITLLNSYIVGQTSDNAARASAGRTNPVAAPAYYHFRM